MTLERGVTIEVAYVGPSGGAFLRTVRIPAPATIRDAVEASSLLAECPEVDLRRHRVGIWSRLAALDASVVDGDRVEVYRPLGADPKDARRSRVTQRRRGK